ncbi:uncharacterized protein LOC116159299 [Photinus pyralis]|nr:uncharacterized protein LOC116159299 [Photinus pyralis]
MVSIDQYFKQYPILRSPLSYHFFEIDFDNTYPNKETVFYVKWPMVAKKIITFAKQKKDAYIKSLLDDYKAIQSDDLDEIFALRVLPLLFNTVNIKTKKVGLHWRPSKIESLNGFIIFVKESSDVQSVLEERQRKLASFKLTTQPVPVVVCKQIDSIESCYVSINTELLKVDTLLKAVDITFKACHVLNAEYSKECDAAWTFLQKYIYDIHTKFDRNYISVNALMSDLGNA